MKHKLKKITEITFEDLVTMVPVNELYSQLEYLCGKREVKKLQEHLMGSTCGIIKEQFGIYPIDIKMFLNYRGGGISKNFPLYD